MMVSTSNKLRLRTFMSIEDAKCPGWFKKVERLAQKKANEEKAQEVTPQHKWNAIKELSRQVPGYQLALANAQLQSLKDCGSELNDIWPTLVVYFEVGTY